MLDLEKALQIYTICKQDAQTNKCDGCLIYGEICAGLYHAEVGINTRKNELVLARQWQRPLMSFEELRATIDMAGKVD